MQAMSDRGTGAARRLAPDLDFQLFVDGDWQAAASGERLDSLDPATGQPWCTIARGAAADVDRAVEAAERAFRDASWAGLNVAERARLLRRIAAAFRDAAPTLAELESRDNGKLLRETRRLIGYLPEYFEHYAGLAQRLGGETIELDKADLFAFTLREPLGVVAAITPWNSPLFLATTKLAPALAAGNTVVLKPSEHASVTTLALARLMTDVGLPPGVVNVVTGLGPEVGAPLVGHRRVARVAFTGGLQSARAVIPQTAHNLAQLSLELGGKSPQIVFADADLESAAMGIVAGVFAASGQSCVAGSRLLVQAEARDELLARIAERAATVRLGDPFDPATDVGPLTVEAQRDQVEALVAAAVGDGATVVCGGERPADSDGWFYRPTVLADLDPSSRTAREEIFGPVLSAFSFGDEDEAVALANDTPFGLAAGIWTRDLARAHRLIKAVDAGTVWVNTYRVVSPGVPFGGRGESGYGLEGGLDALLSYTQSKSAWINTSSAPISDPFVMR
jgi:acyl-CoA reductase-like NAD-dependent aldehyde dehydrogenase